MKKLNVDEFYFLSELVFACICHPETKHGADKSELWSKLLDETFI